MTPCKQRQSTIEKLTAENARLTSLMESWKTHGDSLVRQMYAFERERDELRAENASLETAVATYREEARASSMLAYRARHYAQELLAELDRLKADLEARGLQRKIEAAIASILAEERMAEMPLCSVKVAPAFMHPRAWVIGVDYCVERK